MQAARDRQLAIADLKGDDPSGTDRQPLRARSQPARNREVLARQQLVEPSERRVVGREQCRRRSGVARATGEAGVEQGFSAGRRIPPAARTPPRALGVQTVSTLVAELIVQSWVVGEKRGARWVVEEFVREPEDRRHLVLAALRMVGFVPVSPEALVHNAGRQTKSAAAQPLSDARID